MNSSSGDRFDPPPTSRPTSGSPSRPSPRPAPDALSVGRFHGTSEQLAFVFTCYARSSYVQS